MCILKFFIIVSSPIEAKYQHGSRAWLYIVNQNVNRKELLKTGRRICSYVHFKVTVLSDVDIFISQKNLYYMKISNNISHNPFDIGSLEEITTRVGNSQLKLI